MRKIMNLSIAVVLLAVSFGCSDSNDSSSSSSNNSQTINEIKSAVTSGTWRITYFFDSDTNETSHFAGYNFTFGSSGALTATNGSNTYTGTWSVTESSSSDDSPEDVHFNVGFDSPPDFEDLTDDWEVMGNTSTKIQLTDVSGGGGGTDYLTFEKN
ncbi:hypothetical protein FEDK69T_22180 [Flavobacterium enshiense DK69]|uniref:Lipocalin-like domain-containing protein n=1 Tax=Flavobacterium enshiense DK69 TaxID=1107311 RepID=V6S6H7_9FLAO|nr:hypothetical protein [Flavobacterium enshiense]ESU22236.1 hypothetical protein FEDK69T_22180 [Flavobacterium enshiense DK69]KGO97248.1 hypothetical protein Q767_01190 [Flavobacterium enshiense DK69]